MFIMIIALVVFYLLSIIYSTNWNIRLPENSVNQFNFWGFLLRLLFLISLKEAQLNIINIVFSISLYFHVKIFLKCIFLGPSFNLKIIYRHSCYCSCQTPIYHAICRKLITAWLNYFISAPLNKLISV